ncbi:MAG: phosphoribosylformimino-5-aminoimidazole carboxamide ribotide isomerase, partial [Verrucomicrobiota bacterium]
MAMTKFRPCVDLHGGKVKQVVGGSFVGDEVEENFVAEEGPEFFVEKYRADGLEGGHVIQLGRGNEEVAKRSLAAWPGGMQLGGGVTVENAEEWLEAGASAVIVTSALFDAEGQFLPEKLRELAAAVCPERLVVDLSCRRVGEGWVVAMNRWQTLTDLKVEAGVLDDLASLCGEFLIHAADVEGKCAGVD